MLTATAMSVTADPATNRISGLSYDANGNVTNLPGVGAHTYDGRNRVTSVAGGSTRGYDPSNKKIWWKDAQANLYVDFYGPGGKLGTYQLYMPANGSAVPLFGKVAEYTYFAGRLVKGESPWTNGFVQQDRLGSAVTHLPYGDERTVTAQGRLKFATYWREDSGVDYADQRYYSSTYGRFLTSDPYRASGGPSDPGSWNRYAYVQGDPVNFVDPRGLATVPVSFLGYVASSIPPPIVSTTVYGYLSGVAGGGVTGAEMLFDGPGNILMFQAGANTYVGPSAAIVFINARVSACGSSMVPVSASPYRCSVRLL